MIRQVVSKPLGKYEVTTDMRGQTFATKENEIYLVVFAYDRQRNNEYETFHYLVPLFNNQRSTLTKVITKTQLLKEYNVFVATTKDDSKKLIADLIA
jgi:hypothetical protein